MIKEIGKEKGSYKNLKGHYIQNKSYKGNLDENIEEEVIREIKGKRKKIVKEWDESLERYKDEREIKEGVKRGYTRKRNKENLMHQL